MRLYRSRKDAARTAVLDKYNILGFLASGTYGRVYKATVKQPADRAGQAGVVAIKKFKPDKEGDANGPVYSGISQSACREIMVSAPFPASLARRFGKLMWWIYLLHLTPVVAAQPRAVAHQRSFIARSHARGQSHLHGLRVQRA